jgi:arabinose-5-phosphate isomerase
LSLANRPDRGAILARGREVVMLEAEALEALAASLDDGFAAACDVLLAASRRIVVTGMGKSGHIARKIAATLAATGTPALYLHPAEAAHGDLGMMMPGDVLLVLSNSGNTAELRAVLDYAHKLDIRIIGIVSRRESLVNDHADVVLVLPAIREACAANVAPTTSTTLQLAMGDALAMAVMDLRGISQTQMRALHPAGTIGLRLSPIAELMHGREELPLVTPGAGMQDVISVITSCRFGLAGVVDARGELVGVITDGDLRRNFERLATATAGEVMTRSPRSIPADMLAGDALLFLNDAKITAAFVVNRLDALHLSRPIGIVHIHDLLKHGLG